MPAAKRGGFQKGAPNQFRSQKSVEERTADGIVFDSKYEMIGYELVKRHVPEGYWQRQVKFSLLPKKVIHTRGVKENILPMTWSCDFLIGPPYVAGQPLSDDYLVIDVKGNPTEQFKVRLKLFKWCWEHSPLIVNINSKAKQWAFVETLQKHCKHLGIS